MGVAWAVYLLLIIFFFKEPQRPTPSGHVSGPASEKNLASSTGPTLTEPLLATLSGALPNNLTLTLPKDKVPDVEENEVDDSEYDDERAVETFGELMKELTMPIKILLWIYFMLKYASELLISESSILTTYYFDWSTYQVYLLGICLLLLFLFIWNAFTQKIPHKVHI